MKPDTRKLTEAVELCFEHSMDTDLTASQRAKFLFQGKELKSHLDRLLGAQLDEKLDEEVDEANSRLGEVVKQLRKKVDELAQIKEVLTELRGISKLLTTLLTGAVSLI
jgi:GTP1/Obg family GTP-binding protein